MCPKTDTAQSDGAVVYTDCISAEGLDPPTPSKYPRYDIKQAGALGNAEYPFIAITLRSTLAQNGSTR